MGVVTDHLCYLLKTQVTRHGVVVWYDPQGHYPEVVTALNLPNTAVHRFQGSFFLLRHEIEPYLAQDQAPNLVVYVDMDRSRTRRALAEVEAAGVVLEPTGSGQERDTALTTLGRAALATTLSPSALAEILRNDSLTLSDLDRIAQGTGPVTGALSLIFGSSASPSDVALVFLANSDIDGDISNRSAQSDLAALLREAFGFTPSASGHLSDLRTHFIRHILLIDFRASIAGKTSAQILAGVPFPTARWQIEACQRLAARWRDSLKHRLAYEVAAHQVEQDYAIPSIELSPETWQAVQTFPWVENKLLAWAEQRLLDGGYGKVSKLAEERQDSFWNVDENALRWSLIHTIASLHQACARVHQALPARAWSAHEMVVAYTQGLPAGNEAWCALDRLYRHMERLNTGSGTTPAIDKAVVLAREAYTTVAQQMAELFGEVLLKTQLQVPGVMQQIDTFRTQVAPQLERGKVAYLWIDALRFEMAQELLSSLSNVERAILIPALGTLPTVTEVGMAALLPGAERGLGLIEMGGKLAVEVNGQPLRTRKDRVEYLTQRGGYSVEVFTLADMLKPNRVVKERVERAQLIVVTSQEIDGIAEKQPPYLARNTMEDILIYIKRVLHQLTELGISSFVIASDHGFLFGNELDTDMQVAPPDGQTIKLTERVWVGRGGPTPGGCLRVKASEIGLSGDLDLVFPPGLASFIVRGGADPYCHGSFSLQEFVVPVMIVQMTPAKVLLTQGDFSLTMERPWITARVFTVAASYTKSGLFDVTSRRVYCTAWHKGEVVAQAVVAAYGYDNQTKQVILEHERVNHITLIMMSEVTQGFLTVSLTDVETEAELKRLENVEVKIAI